MKKEFELVTADNKPTRNFIRVIGLNDGVHWPYVLVEYNQGKDSLFVHDKDLERFAVNILKALKSKKLKQ